MATTKRPGKLTIPAELLLAALDELRQAGQGAYPPTLRALAERAGIPAEQEADVQKAAGKKDFTVRAVVTEKDGRKPKLDAPVYFQEDVPAKPKPAPKPPKPRPNKVADLAGRMLAVLESQRTLGGEAYPPTLRRLAELSGVRASDADVPKAALHATMAERTRVAAMVGKTRPNLDAPVYFKAGASDSVLPALLVFALSPPPKPARGKKEPEVTHAWTIDDLAKRLDSTLKEPFQESLRAAMDRPGGLPGVGWVVIKGKEHLFRLEHLHIGGPIPNFELPAEAPGLSPVHLFDPDGDGATATHDRPAADFAASFREAFERLDRRNGATNFVKLADLRRELAGFGRDAFDAGLRRLREAREFTLDSHEGLYGSLTPEDREAGVREADSLLIYASRR